MSIYDTIKAQMIKAGIEEPDRFLVKPGTQPPEPREMATSNISVLVEFWLHPMRDVMCCKVAGNVRWKSPGWTWRTDNYAPFFDALYEALDGVLDLMVPPTLAIETTIEPLSQGGDRGA